MTEQVTIVTNIKTLRSGDRIRHTGFGEVKTGTVTGHKGRFNAVGNPEEIVTMAWDDQPGVDGILNLDAFFGDHTVELLH